MKCLPRIWLFAGLAAICFNAAAQSPPTSGSAYSNCMTNNAQMRQQLAAAPEMPGVSLKLARIMLDDRVCECIKTQESNSLIANADPALRYISANSICLPPHLKKEFAAQCPALYQTIFVEAGKPKADVKTLADLCACATNELNRSLTPESLKNSQIEQYRYYTALVEDKKNGTDKAKQLGPPPPDALAQGLNGIAACMRQ